VSTRQGWSLESSSQRAECSLLSSRSWSSHLFSCGPGRRLQLPSGGRPDDRGSRRRGTGAPQSLMGRSIIGEPDYELLVTNCARVYNSCAGLSQARYGIDNVVLSAGRALVGDTLTASCDIHIDVPDPARPPIMLLYWIRQTPKQQLPHVEISVNRGLNNAFLDTGRYSVRALQLDGMSRMQFQLNITGIINCLPSVSL